MSGRGGRLARWATPALVVLTLAAGVVHGRVIGVVLGGASRGDEPVRAELAFVRAVLDSGGGERMQELFPEGYFFTHALFGLAWCDLAADGRADAATAARQARWALSRLGSPAGTAPFARSLTPTYGIFYAGWSLLLRAGVAALDAAGTAGFDRGGGERGDDGLRALAEAGDEVAAAVQAALDAGRPPFLEAYPGQAWPVDTVVALAGLRAADAVTGADHGDLVRRWVKRAEAHADPRTGLLPHRVEAATGRTLQPSRGSSQSIVQRFWPALDPDGARRSYLAFRRHFVTRELGVVAVREYPHGVDGPGDVDSGPLPLGVSVSATAVAIGAARVHGDRRLAAAVTDEIDAFGVPFAWDGRRRYAGGVLPVGDAFVAWARAAPLDAEPAEQAERAERDYPALRPLWPAWLALPWAAVFAGWALRLRRLVVPSARRTPRPQPISRPHVPRPHDLEPAPREVRSST
jgi:hypothetical protein